MFNSINNMSEKVFFDNETKHYIFKCPNCELFILVPENSVNCSIFRHGYYFEKNNREIILTNQINPHTNKETCENLVRENKIIGCGKPFQMFKNLNGEFFVKTCEYI